MDCFVSFCEEQEKQTTPNPDAKEWKQIFEGFSQEFKTSFKLPNLWHKDKKERILGYLVDLLQTDLWPLPVKTLCISCLKIITRTRTDLGPLFRSKNIEFLFLCLKGDHDDASKIEALSLILNLCIINQARMMKTFGSIPVQTKKKDDLLSKTENLQVAQKKKESTPLYTQLADALTSQKASREVNFLLLRLIWHVTIQKNFARVMIADYDMFPFLFQMLMTETGYCASGGLPAIMNLDSESLSRRKIASYALQILFNLIMDSSLPAASSKVTMDFFNKFADCCKEILSLGIKNEETRPWLVEENWTTKMVEIEVPIEDSEDDEGDDDKDDEDDEDDADVDDCELLTAAEFLGQQKKKDMKRKTQKMEKKTIRKRVMKPHLPILPIPEEGTHAASLLDLKFNVSNLMIYMPNRLGQGMIMNDDYRAIHGLCEMLYRQAQIRDRKLSADALTPIVTALIRLSKGSKEATEYLRWYIFHDLAEVPKTKKNSNLGMAPQGQTKHRLVDDGSLRYILTSYMTSFDMQLKSVVSEFLWQLCGCKKYELIRLTGFGNAVGLLAAKGLPGFTGLTDNAINLDDIVEARRAAKNKQNKPKK